MGDTFFVLWYEPKTGTNKKGGQPLSTTQLTPEQKVRQRYAWSGHSTVMGNGRQHWMDTVYVLSQFGVRKKAARNAYHRYVAEGMAMGKRSEFTGGGLIRSKGGGAK